MPGLGRTIEGWLQFTWRIHGNYRVTTADEFDLESDPGEDAPSWSGRVLTWDPRGGKGATWSLRDRPTLFLDFAQLGLEEPAILNFAKRHGHLGLERPIFVGQRGRPRQAVEGERLNDWRRETVNMRDVTMLWDLVQRRDEAALRQHVVWTRRKRHVTFRAPNPPRSTTAWEESATPGDHTAVIASTTYRRRLFARLRPGDVVGPAIAFIQGTVNGRLAHAGLTIAHDGAAWHPGLHPTTLLAALWLQLASAVCAGSELRRCATCHRLFGASRSGRRARKDRKTCGPACRQRAHRAKRRPRPRSARCRA